MTNHQRIGVPSNSHAGRTFELQVKEFFEREHELVLLQSIPIDISVSGKTIAKPHRFDLGCNDPSVLIECKSHNWTLTGNMSSAKMTVWNEAMYYFHLAPKHYRKILAVLESSHERKQEKLAAYYARIKSHLIPDDVEIMEFNDKSCTARWIKSRY